MLLEHMNKTLKPPIFIYGSGRSGTTLLLNVLSKHPNIYCIKKETNLFVRPKDDNFLFYDKCEEILDFKNLTESMLTVMFYGTEYSLVMRKMGRFPKEIIELANEITQIDSFKSIKNKYDIFNLCVNYLTIKENKTRWVEKTPNNIFNAKYILNSYPNAKFIEIYRDPRGVSYSWINAKHIFFRTSNLTECIIRWTASLNEGIKLSKLIPNQLYRLKYEDLINNPEKELKSLCIFLNEEFDHNMLKAKVIDSSFELSKGEFEFLKTPKDRWLNGLSTNQKIFVDILTKKYRKKLHYPDSGARLTFFNSIPFILFVTNECIKARKQLMSYFQIKAKSFTNIFK